jgi:CheY-like chemotaxis protein
MKRILVVEDDLNQRHLYVTELTDEGYEVYSAGNGEEALKTFGECQPDLVVLDINMPRIDGLDVLGRLLSACPQLPIIIHTAYPAYEDDFMSWSADAYVCKSSDLVPLKDHIRQALAKSESPGLKSSIRTKAA